jgi:hypothetical protein
LTEFSCTIISLLTLNFNLRTYLLVTWTLINIQEPVATNRKYLDSYLDLCIGSPLISFYRLDLVSFERLSVPRTVSVKSDLLGL